MIDQSFHGDLEVLHEPPSGGPSGHPPLVFLHGAFADAWIWAERFLPWFAARGYAAYALSFRGHGGSAGAEDLHDFGAADYVDDALSLIRSFEDPPVVIGHSMGGYIAQKVVNRIDVSAYVLMASVPPTGLMGPVVTMAWFQPRLLSRIAEIQSRGVEAVSTDTLREAFFWRDASKWLVAADLTRVQNESRRATLDLYWPAVLTPARLRQSPALVIGAEHDRFVAPIHVYQTAAIVGAAPVFVPDIGHAMMLEKGWENVAERIDQFVTEQVTTA